MKVSRTFQPSERTVHHPDILGSVSSNRNLRRGETNNKNDTHGAVGGRSCGRARARELGDVCCWADSRARGGCNDFGRECGGDRGEDGCCRAQTPRSPQTCCGAQARRSQPACCGAQARRALTDFVDWILRLDLDGPLCGPWVPSRHGRLTRGFGYRGMTLGRSAREAFALT